MFAKSKYKNLCEASIRKAAQDGLFFPNIMAIFIKLYLFLLDVIL
jgi:hypothetical protein|tara:strand:+ start:1696 stop:1830 length:135 start_codon:yes stop_codon:yes gene_type:complete